MDAVTRWLSGLGKMQYATVFEEHGWDNMAAVSLMTMGDVQNCVQKPGHVAQIFHALQTIKCQPKQSAGSETQSLKGECLKCVSRFAFHVSKTRCVPAVILRSAQANAVTLALPEV